MWKQDMVVMKQNRNSNANIRKLSRSHLFTGRGEHRWKRWSDSNSSRENKDENRSSDEIVSGEKNAINNSDSSSEDENSNHALNNLNSLLKQMCQWGLEVYFFILKQRDKDKFFFNKRNRWWKNFHKMSTVRECNWLM